MNTKGRLAKSGVGAKHPELQLESAIQMVQAKKIGRKPPTISERIYLALKSTIKKKKISELTENRPFFGQRNAQKHQPIPRAGISTQHKAQAGHVYGE